MLSSDDTDYTSTDTLERSYRAASRREIINEKRQKNTDILPHINGETLDGKNTIRQLRAENKRLRWQLDELQHLIYQHKQTQAQLEKEIDTIHRSHQDVIEQYEMNLREMIDERNQLQETKREWEQRYQELYHSFHDTVEEEANKMVEEAARTLVLSPEHTPALLRDVAKTLEFQTKQTEDQHVAELLSLMRQAQYKAVMLEQELANEREKIAIERQNLLALQHSISERAQFRYDTMRKHLQTRWTLILTLMAAVLILLVPIFQLMFLSIKAPLAFALFAPVVICVALAFLFARARTNSTLQQANKQLNQKATTRLTQTPTAKKV
jgi:DNA repair exonuclease SbcCD ATPase subunit